MKLISELISIIVPVYKVEKYLERCIDSILNQSYRNFELILVDDGSPDGCGAICDTYAKRDSRISVIHKSNGGLSDARNAGLKLAKGTYIAFVDSDDWISSKYLERLIKVLKLTESDICECEILRTKGNGEDLLNVDSEVFRIYDTQEALEMLIRDLDFHQYVWNKLYKRDCLEGIFFDKGKTNEDEFWTYQIFGKAKRVVKISEVLYFYYQREDSIMGTGYNLSRLDALEAKLERLLFIEDNFPALSDIAKVNLYSSCIYSGQMTLKFLQNQEKRQAKLIINKFLKKCKPSKKNISVLNGRERIWVRLASWNFWGVCWLKNALHKGF